MVLDLEEKHPQLHSFSAKQRRCIFQYIQGKVFRLNSKFDLTTKLADALLSNKDRCNLPLD